MAEAVCVEKKNTGLAAIVCTKLSRIIAREMCHRYQHGQLSARGAPGHNGEQLSNEDSISLAKGLWLPNLVVPSNAEIEVFLVEHRKQA